MRAVRRNFDVARIIAALYGIAGQDLTTAYVPLNERGRQALADACDEMRYIPFQESDDDHDRIVFPAGAIGFGEPSYVSDRLEEFLGERGIWLDRNATVDELQDAGILRRVGQQAPEVAEEAPSEIDVYRAVVAEGVRFLPLSERARDQLGNFATRQPDGSVVFPSEYTAAHAALGELLYKGTYLARNGATLYGQDERGVDSLTDFPTHGEDGSLLFTQRGAEILDQTLARFGWNVSEVVDAEPAPTADILREVLPSGDVRYAPLTERGRDFVGRQMYRDGTLFMFATADERVEYQLICASYGEVFITAGDRALRAVNEAAQDLLNAAPARDGDALLVTAGVAVNGISIIEVMDETLRKNEMTVAHTAARAAA